MKKIVFYITLILTVLVLIRLVKAVGLVSENVSNFGLGFITGLSILLIFFGVLTFIFGRKAFNK
jgi:hypothetical protein